MNSLLQTAITAALQAGKAILDIYDDPASDFEIEHKADHSPLTIADRVSNEIILKQLKNTPYPVISEENKATAYAIRKQWQMVWIVDPLDGTKEFIKRNGEFTVNIALVYGGRPALGVIYIPVKKILYYGTIRNGAYRADHPEYSPDMDFDALENQARRLPLDREDPVYTVVALAPDRKGCRKRIISPGWVHSLGLQQRRSIKSLVYCKIKQTGNMKY